MTEDLERRCREVLLEKCDVARPYDTGGYVRVDDAARCMAAALDNAERHRNPATFDRLEFLDGALAAARGGSRE